MRRLAIALLFASCGLSERCSGGEIDTVVAERFDEAGFVRLELGASPAVAEAAAGTPLAVICGKAGEQTWHFTHQATGAIRFAERVLVFRGGVLAQKVSRITYDEFAAEGEFVDFMMITKGGPHRAQDACRSAAGGG